MEADTAVSRFAVLHDARAEHFVEKGYVVVDGCLDRGLVRRWTDRAWMRLGYDPRDPSTWAKDIVWMNREAVAPVREISPRAWGAICDQVL